jgi:hypothetical protein
MTRTEAILDAVRQELDRHRPYLDRIDGLRSVMLVIKVRPGTREVRAVIFSPEVETSLLPRGSPQ